MAGFHVAGSSGSTSGAVTSTPPPATRMEPSGSGAGAASAGAKDRVLEERAGSSSGQDRERLRRVGRSHDHFEEDRGQPLGRGGVHFAGQRHDAAVRGDRVAGERRLPRLERGSARSAAPHGLVCLTTTQAGPRSWRAMASAPRGVQDVVVREGLALQDRAARANGPAHLLVPGRR